MKFEKLKNFANPGVVGLRDGGYGRPPILNVKSGGEVWLNFRCGFVI